MAKDLELHEHHDTHLAGESCGSDPFDCLTKTRVWQTLLVCETMVGGPQGQKSRNQPFKQGALTEQAGPTWALTQTQLTPAQIHHAPTSTSSSDQPQDNLRTLSVIFAISASLPTFHTD